MSGKGDKGGKGGKGGGPAAPRPPPAPKAMCGAAKVAAKRTARPVTGMSLEDALKGHKFKNTGIVPVETTRADIEAKTAASTYVPSRIRMANAAWQEAYGDVATEPADGEGESRPGRHAHFPAEDTLADVTAFEVDDSVTLHPPAPWSASAGTKAYRLKIMTNLQTLGDASTWPPFPPGHDPTAIWSLLSVAQRFPPPSQVFRAGHSGLSDKVPGAVRCVCISDTHGKHAELGALLPEGDILLHAGDFSMAGSREEVEEFGKWFSSLPYPKKVLIAGNHDLGLDAEMSGREVHGLTVEDCVQTLQASLDESVTYLQDSEVTIQGVRIYGTPWQPEFMDWAFNVMRGPAIAEKWDLVPAGVDVLLCHGPPLGRGDLTDLGARAGCADLLRAVQSRIRPAFCVYGHVHEGAGATFDGTTHFLNASSVNVNYVVEYAPFVFDVMPAQED